MIDRHWTKKAQGPEEEGEGKKEEDALGKLKHQPLILLISLTIPKN